MKPKLTPLHHLWILFCLQLAMLMALLVLFAVFQPRFDRLVSQAQEADAKMPLLKQRLDQADSERLHKDALILLDSSATQSKFVQSMETNLIRLLGVACFLLFVITCWLGIITFQLHQASKVNRNLQS
jgi:hypothetical protein